MTPARQWMVVGAAAALLGGGFWLWTRQQEFAQVSVGTSAPDFRAVTLDSSRATKGIADYQGQVVLLNLWATWCGPCRVEMPSIQRLYDRYRDAGLRVVAVAVDDPGFEPEIRDFVRQYGLTFEILHEGSGRIEQDYQSMGLPSTFLIGRDGRIRKLHLGASDWDSAANQAIVAQLLGVPSKTAVLPGGVVTPPPPPPDRALAPR